MTVHGTVALSHLVALPLIIAGMVLAELAAIRFARDRHRGAAQGLFAAAGVVLAVDVLQIGALGHSAKGAVSAETVLRVSVFALLALAALRRTGALRGEEARAIAERERRRLARDLHDGPCQDLAFIVSVGSLISASDGGEHPVVVAAARGLASCRGILADLSASHAGDLRGALRSVADDLAFKFGISVEVRADRAEVRDADREEIVRIAREAIVNAARHGGARRVVVALICGEDALMLRVTDDGRGLTASNRRREGYGMTSMRDRAAMIGAHLEVRRGPEGGTELEVVIR